MRDVGTYVPIGLSRGVVWLMDKGGIYASADPISDSTLREIDGCVCANGMLLSFVVTRSADRQYGEYFGRVHQI